jgi:dUTP pyrophosphatase
MSLTRLFFKKLDDRAKLPTQRKGDVGLDVRCLEDFVIPPGKTVKVRTGLALAKSPESGLGAVFLKMEDRSSMALKGIFSHGGIIDPNYRGEFHVILFNSSDKEYEGVAGDKVAQAVVYPAAFNHQWSFTEVEECDELEASNRGAGGFGSTGR